MKPLNQSSMEIILPWNQYLNYLSTLETLEIEPSVILSFDEFQSLILPTIGAKKDKETTNSSLSQQLVF